MLAVKEPPAGGQASLRVELWAPSQGSVAAGRLCWQPGRSLLKGYMVSYNPIVEKKSLDPIHPA